MTVLAPALGVPAGRRAVTRASAAEAAEARLLGVVAVLVLALVVCAAVSPARGRVTLPLWQAGVAVGAGGRIRAISDHDRLVPGTRVLASAPDAAGLAAEQRAWLAAGSVPHPSALGAVTGRDDLVTDALLDLHLLAADGGPIAGWSPAWHYVWPRDAAFVALAFARTGHLRDAEQVLTRLQSVQADDGTFRARYVPGTGSSPDDRPTQLDGTGWAVWALDRVADSVPATDARRLLEGHRRLLDRSSALLLARTSGPGFPVSPDYWEVREHRPTLATSAVLLAGLDAAARAYRRLGDPAAAARLGTRATTFGERLLLTAGPGFGRHLGDDAATADLGVAFLLPPFAPSPSPAVLAGWRRSLAVMARPNGGLGPGGGWRDDGIAWTPSVASEAMVAAAVGDRGRAVDLLRWLDDNRTPQGAIPEKVLWNGRGAYVAPLAWSAAAVVIAASELGS